MRNILISVPGKKEKLPLSVTHPELAKEADGWNPTSFTYGSNKKLRWKCKQGHISSSSPNSRTNNNLGCPVCSNYQVLAGYNDLATTFPEIAREAEGWDPTTLISGSRLKMHWRCSKNHVYRSSIFHRTFSQSGCPFCSNSKVLAGYNDLASTFPEIASEAEGWDPTSVMPGSNTKRKWKCGKDHIWESAPNSRTGQNQGCAVCANKKILSGYNDVATTFPEIAREAYGWDPTKVIAGSNKNLTWICPAGHHYSTKLTSRTTSATGCPICANKILLVGFNDFATKFPEIASEADGWDPTLVFPGSTQKVNWVCPKNHKYVASLNNRTRGQGSTCPVCSNTKVLAGYNDLASTFPEIASEAEGWDPTSLLPGSGLKRIWRCKSEHKYSATLHSRTTSNTGCPSCATTGFDPNKDGFLYFLTHVYWEMYQIGITNNPNKRLSQHNTLGWELLELRGPMDGHLTQQWETAILRMLKAKGADLSNSKIAGKFDGYSEAWSKSTFEVKTIKELMRLTGEFEQKSK